MDVIAILKAAQKVASLTEGASGTLRKIEVSEALQKRFEATAEQVNRDMNQVCFAVCTAIVAHALGREPSDGEVNGVLEGAIQNPAFPARAYRLLGEARKAASRRRRVFLASMLFGLSFSKVPDDERDRVDMTVERMTVEDAELLMMISDKRTSPSGNERNLFGPLGIGVMTDADLLADRPVVRLVTPDPEADVDSVRYPVQREVFSSLMLLGCVERGREVSKQDGWYGHHLLLTALGEMVIRALEEVRVGLNA